MKNHISPLGAFRLKPLLYRSIIASSLLIPGISQAEDCKSLVIWNDAQAYNGGAQVQHLDTAYSANWWTKGNDPETRSGPYQEWSSLGACDGGPTNTPPQVALTSPLNNASFSENDNVVIDVNASDSDGTIASVEYLVDGVSIGTSNQAPYSQNWAATIGNHEIKTIATDNLGASASAIINISVASVGGNIPPSATQTSPTADSQITAGDITLLTADVADSDGAITQVDFYLDDVLLATVASAPFQHNWTATEGLHSFKVKATDNDGAESFSPSVQVNVSGGQVGGGCAGVPAFVAGTSYQSGNEVENINHKYRCDVAGWCSSTAAWAYEPGVGEHWGDAWSDLGICAIVPEITITSPAGNAVVLANTSVDFNVDASDSDGNVTQVEFFAAGSSLGVDTTAPYSVSWAATNPGDIQLKAVATDNEANTAEETLLVTVSNEPIVASISATNTSGTVTLGKTVNFTATASSVVGEITGIEFMVNGAALSSDSNEPYTASWTPGSMGSYTITAKATDSQGNNVTSSALSINVIGAPVGQTHKLIGYWHDFVNPAGCPMPLKEISSKWDVIDIAFADNDRNSNGTVHFNLFSGDIHSTCPALDASEFKQDMAALQAQGKIIVLSLGGAEGNITLNTNTDEANFVSSLTAIIAEWGFDGLDIDLESGSNLLHGTQIQARLPRALKQIETNMGGDMYLTMAPEHPYVQGGMVAYSGIWGAYIPLIDELRDTLDLLHVQLYNNGGLTNPYMSGAAAEGSVDMMVASVKMLVEGFELADGTQFLPLRDDQVAIGLPSGPASANSGQAPTQNIIDALDCITKGVACGSIVPNQHFPNFGGVMTWSINWDKYDGYNFSGPIGDKIDAMNASN